MNDLNPCRSGRGETKENTNRLTYIRPKKSLLGSYLRNEIGGVTGRMNLQRTNKLIDKPIKKDNVSSEVDIFESRGGSRNSIGGGGL